MAQAGSYHGSGCDLHLRHMPLHRTHPQRRNPTPTPAITVVLQAYTDDAFLMLFIERDQFRYLELAPLAPDGNIPVFPGPEHIRI